MTGLFRKYDGKYVVALGEVIDTESGIKKVCFEYLDNNTQYCCSKSDFEGDTYEHIIMTTEGEKKERLPILQHPYNTTGQEKCFIKVEHLDNFEKNLGTEDLINELKRRKDNPLANSEFNSKVFSEDFVVGVPIVTDKRKGVQISAICDTVEEAKAELLSYALTKKNSRMCMFKRVFIKEIDEVSI